MVEAFGWLMICFGAITIFYGLMSGISMPDDDLMSF